MHLDLKATGCGKKPRETDQRGNKKSNGKMGQGRFVFPAPSMAHSAAPSLILPDISSLPTKLHHQKSAESSASIALSLLDMGMASDEDAVYASAPAVMVERIFERWIMERTKGIKALSPHFVITDSVTEFGERNDDTHHEGPQIVVGISYSDENAVFLSLKDKVEILEKVIPGLGETALSHLYGWIWRTTLAISPDFVHSLVQHHYWCGGDDENDYLEEFGGDGEDIECPVTLAAFEEDFPRYVYQPSGKLGQKALKQLACHRDDYVAEVAKFLLSQPDIKKWGTADRPQYLNDLESDSEGVGYAAVLNWGPGGSPIADQVCNDWLRYAYEGGSTDLFAVFQFERNTEGVKSLFENLEQFIAALTWVDKAITLFGTPEP